MASELENINKTLKQNNPFIRDKNGKLVKNPDYKQDEAKKEEIKKEEVEKKVLPPTKQEQPKLEVKPSVLPKPLVYAPAVDKNGTDSKTQEFIGDINEESQDSSNGISGDKMLEPMPEYIVASCEKVIQGENNSFIVLGRDRPGNRTSGYGGKGDTKCGSVDIVVGRVGYESRQVDENDKQLWVDPSFIKDSARIHISQKTDVDDNFDLANGKVGNAKTKSAIGLKADGIRIVAREGIKLVTGTDKYNSQGGEIKVISGIDLIANNDDSELQSIPKGQNLQQALERIVNHIDKLNGIVDALVMIQSEYNKQIMSHWHNSPFFAMPTTPSEILLPTGAKCLVDMTVQVKKSLVTHKKNLAAFKLTYLNVFGKKYINSRYNNVN